MKDEKGTMFYKNPRKIKNKKKQDWYKEEGRYESIMYVDSSPKSAWKKKIQSIVKRNKMKIKVVERVGKTVKGMLQKSSVFTKRESGRNDCEMCKRGLKVNCRTRGCVYDIKCKTHEHKYDGTTGRSIYERIGEHIESWRKKEENSPLQKHAETYHDGEEFEIELKIVAECFGNPSKRLITEAVVIDEISDEITINAKREWSYVKLSKIQET